MFDESEDWSVEAHPGECLAVAFSMDGASIASISKKGKVGIVDVHTQQRTQLLTFDDANQMTNKPLSLHFTTNCLVAGCSNQLAARVWDLTKLPQQRAEVGCKRAACVAALCHCTERCSSL